jgi:hypothetical protein
VFVERYGPMRRLGFRSEEAALLARSGATARSIHPARLRSLVLGKAGELRQLLEGLLYLTDLIVASLTEPERVGEGAPGSG